LGGKRQRIFIAAQKPPKFLGQMGLRIAGTGSIPRSIMRRAGICIIIC
jgi:hypothetical protein